MHRLILFVGAALFAACDPANLDDPEYNQRLGPATGIFAGFTPDDCICNRSRTVNILCSEAGANRSTQLELPDVLGKGRVQVEGGQNIMGTGSLPVFFELEAGELRDDPRARSFTGVWFPLRVYKALAFTGRCNAPEDLTACQEEGDGTLGDSLFWCSLVGQP